MRGLELSNPPQELHGRLHLLEDAAALAVAVAGDRAAAPSGDAPGAASATHESRTTESGPATGARLRFLV